MFKKRIVTTVLLCVLMISTICCLSSCMMSWRPSFDSLKADYVKAVAELYAATEDTREAAQKKVVDAKDALVKAYPDEAKKFFDTEAAKTALMYAQFAFEDKIAELKIAAESVEAVIADNEELWYLKKAVDDAQAAYDALLMYDEKK